MKKYQLKKSYTYILVIIELFLMCLLSSECEDIKIFVISKIIFMIMFAIIAIVLEKYGNKKIIK